MSRATATALTKLVSNMEAAGYSLPTDLLDAYRTYQRVAALTLPPLPNVETETLAARVVSACAAGEEPDVNAVARQMTEVVTQREAIEHARRLLATAVEQASSDAVLLGADLTERIIVDHLRPAWQSLLDEVRTVADLLAGHSLEAHALLSAPTKVRNAYLALPALVSRYSGLKEARRSANVIGERKPQHDATHLYADFRNPLAFHPQWRPPARVPRIPYPEDATQRLLWLVSGEVTKAEPWFPTLAEQDAAWWQQFGEAQENRARAHRDGLAIGARIGA